MPLVGAGHARWPGRGMGAVNGAARRRAGPAVDRRDAGHAGDPARVAPLRPRGGVRPRPARRASSGSALGQAAGQWVVVGDRARRSSSLFAWGLRNLAAGRAVYATGSDPEAARLAGIRPRRVVFGVFVVDGGARRAGGAAERGPVRRRRPQRGRRGWSCRSIAAVVVGGAAVSGGRGTLVGTLIGVAPARLDRPGARLPRHASRSGRRRSRGSIILLAVASDAFDRGGR